MFTTFDLGGHVQGKGFFPSRNELMYGYNTLFICFCSAATLAFRQVKHSRIYMCVLDLCHINLKVLFILISCHLWA